MYTKGDWRFVPDEFNRNVPGNCIGSIEAHNKDDDLESRWVCTMEDTANAEEENLANAHLIASAPDLYEALKVAHRELLHAQWEDGLDQIEEAIAKVENEVQNKVQS